MVLMVGRREEGMWWVYVLGRGKCPRTRKTDEWSRREETMRAGM